MAFADRVMIDIAHHVDDFAGHSFFGTDARILFSVLMLVREREWRDRERRNKHRTDRDFQEIWII